jgi:hypothetical protein
MADKEMQRRVHLRALSHCIDAGCGGNLIFLCAANSSLSESDRISSRDGMRLQGWSIA